MFLDEPSASDEREALYDGDRDADGYVNNHTRLWAWRPDLRASFAALRSGVMGSSALTDRDWALLVTATASELGDSYCSLAWGVRLAELTDDETAAGVLAARSKLSERDAALVDWARQVVRDPNATTQADVDRLRELGFGDQEIFEATAFVGFRLAFSTINDALGTAPDQQLADRVPEVVRAAVGYGRAPSSTPSHG
jgi:alkylhydroperoxidase family enzyme